MVALFSLPSECLLESKAMARTQAFAKMNKKLKFAVRNHNRCKVCGRPRAFYRKFELCRICLRKFALQGDIPGVTKSSW